jgi:hypothetical protein
MIGGPAAFTAVQAVWRWPLKRRGFNLQGGVDALQISDKVVFPDFETRDTVFFE